MFTKLASYWATIFVLPLTCANFTDVCNETYSSTRGLQCFPCQPGYAKTDDCSTNQTHSQCMQCTEGTYQPHCISANETEQCRNCTKCVVYMEHCTIYRNAVCRESDSTTDGLDDNRERSWVTVFFAVLCAVVILLFMSALLLLLLWYRRMRRSYKISGNSAHDHLKLIEVNKRKGGNIFNRHTNTEKWLKDTSFRAKTKQMNTENKNIEEQTNNGTQLSLAENQNVDVKELESEEKDKNGEAKTESKRKKERISITVPVAIVRPSQDKLTRESLQSSADGENAQENAESRNNGQTINDTQSATAGNQNDEVKELAEYKKGTQTLKIDWLTIFLKLAKAFPPTEWEMFALNLLSNCQRIRNFNAHEAVAEIKLEVRSEYSTGWVIHSYIKVFNKWLKIMGDTEATIEQIEQAVAHSIDSKEVMDLVLSIKRDPPILPSSQSLAPRDNEHIRKNQLPNVQQCFALHDSEIPGASCSVQHSSRQMHSIQASGWCTCSTFVPNTAELQDISNCQAVQTSFRYNTLRYETNGNIEYQTPNKQKDRGKKRKRKTSKLQDKLKLRKLESYVRENAKQNLLSDHIQIRQSDYDVYMEHVIALLMKECKVNRKVVSFITYQAFCEVKEIRTSQNETLYLLYGGKPRLCLTKDVYDDLAVYGKCARPKLIAYLDEQKVKYNKPDVDTFLFISFKGDAVFEQLGFQGQRARNVKNVAITNSLQTPVSTASMKDFDTSNIDTKAGHTSKIACQTEDDNNNSKPEDQKQDEEIIDMNKTFEKVCDASPPQCKRDASEFKIEMDEEMEIIRDSLFPSGKESFKIVNEDTIPSKLKSFVDQG